jgi:uncharacterized membrane protein YvlD (DUF360 family)
LLQVTRQLVRFALRLEQMVIGSATPPLTMSVFLFIVIVAVVLGIIGAVVKGLLFLLWIGIAVFVADLVFLGARFRGGAPRKR